MVKFLIGLVTGVALVFLSLILLFVVALRFRESAPVIADNSVLVLRLTGELPEKPPMELPSFLGDDHTPLTVIGVWSALEKAAADARIKAVVVLPEGLSADRARGRHRAGRGTAAGRPEGCPGRAGRRQAGRSPGRRPDRHRLAAPGGATARAPR